MALNDVYTEVLGEHSREPYHKHAISNPTITVEGRNPSCGDEITLQLRVENGIVKDVGFTGIGCAISQASTDIMADLMIGKPVKEVRRLAEKFIAMIKGEITDDKDLEELDEGLALKNVSHMPARVKCAVLAWHTIDDVLNEEEKKKQDKQ